MDLNHDSATERYTETLNSALTYFSSLAQSSAGWKRLSSASVRPSRNGTPGSSGTGRRGSSSASSSLLSATLTGGSAASAAIESLLPSISVSKKSVPGKSAEIVRASITLPGLNEQTDLEDWRAVLECTGARKIWDPMVESSSVLMTLDDSTCITKTLFKTTWPTSPRDALLIETTLLDHNAVLHIATSIKPSEDDPIFLRPSPPHVRAYLPLVVWHIQLVPADLDDTASFTSFNSLTASQNKPVMPRHSIRVSFYYQIDMRGWAINSSVSMQSHVPSCIANVYRLLRRQGVPPHVSRHSSRIQLDLNEYDPTTGIYELRYDVIPADSDNLLTERRTISSAVKQFRLGGPLIEEDPELIQESRSSSNIPQELLLSDEDEIDELDNEHSNEALRTGYVDVELDGEKWGLGTDIVVHIFMNDIEDEEFVQEHVECLKYMGRDRYILRMKHTEIDSHQGAINVKLRIERIPQQQQHSGGTNLLSHQQLRFQRQQQEQERQNQQHQEKGQDQITPCDMSGMIVSVNGQEKNILPLHRPSMQGVKRGSMSLQEQLELSQQIVQEVDDSPSHWRGGSDSHDGLESRTTVSPLLLMSSSMSITRQSLNRSSQSILSNGTSTMSPGNSNPSKVNSSYSYFNSLLHEPASSWKAIVKQRGVQVSKLEVQGHAHGIVKGEGVFEDYSIWDIKAALDCASARKIWDKMFDESHMLMQATPSSTLNYVRLKGFWPTSPKDMAILNTTFVTKDAIHYFTTSVDDTNQFPSIPPPVSPFVRSEVVVSGWYVEAVKPKSVRIVYIAQASPTGWVVPGTALGAMTTEMPLCVAEVIKYLETYGSPPTLVSIRRGRALGVDYSHANSTFRLEYVQDSNPIFSGHRISSQQHQQQQQQAQRRGTADYAVGVRAVESTQFSSPKIGPTDKLLAEIRLDARAWARNGDCEIMIDPPPSKVTCSNVPHDGTGYRLRIEHSSGRAVPAGGKVLVMARKSAKPGCGIVVNGVAIKMPSMEHLEGWTHRKGPSSEKDRALTLSLVDGVLSDKEKQDEDDDDGAGTKAHHKDTSVSLSGESSHVQGFQMPANGLDKRRSPSAVLTPLQYAQGAMELLTRIKADAEDSWTIVSDSKGGMRVTKRFMPTEISDQVPLVRGEKVIEGFSLEEIATVIGTLGTRPKLDGLYESGEMLESFGAGCAIYHYVLKSYFPLPLPARDLYFVTVTASADASARCPQIVILSTSIPSEAAPSLPAPPSSKPPHLRPRAHLHLSAWILEGIDPYSSSHPIPSTRVTYMTALDLGGSVPQRISGMLQTTFPKMITQVENYLQLQAAPPIVRIPEQTIVGQPIDVDALSIDDNRQEKPLVLPSIIPWNQPTNRILTREFRLKDSYFEILVLFDQFRLYPSRLDLATERRSRKAKKPHEKLRSDRGRVMDVDQGGQETAEMTTLDATEEKTKNRTVLELVVDLKQYPVGYNIITSIKVDPEFLLQHKQQRDMGLKQQQQMANLTPNLKLAGSTSAASLTTGVASAGSRFIGGFDEGGSAIDNNNQVSYDGDIGYSGWSKTPTSEAASSGTGIAAVLGSSANVPRALPSSTSLIRILPPPITVNVIDIPPAPSHSSSLSGISRRRKHLIIITVPEAEVSVTHANAQYQAAAAAASLASKGFAPHIISGTTAKPVVTTGSVSGTTSTMFSAEDRVDSKQSRHQASSNSSHDADSAIEAIRPALSPNNTPVPPEAAKPTHQSAQAGQDLETRMFQFGVKIDRLEHKSLDHSALQVTKDSLDTAADEKEWDGKVMVDGIPAKVITGWSRQELGFLDGMMEDDGETSGQQRERGQSFAKESSQRNDAYSDRRREAPSSEEEDDEPQSGNQEDGEGLGPKTTTRRKKHRRQQLANVNENQESGLANVSHRSSTGITSDEGTNRTDTTGSNTRPTSSMYGLSNFLMSVGLLGDSSTRGSKADHDPTTGAPSDDYSHSSVEYDDLDDDRTIRASKSVIRSRLSGILSNNEGKSRRGGGERERRDDDHDLDLESLHGSIVFEDYGEYSDDGYNNNGGPHGSVHHGEGKDKEISDWARHSSSVRRRKGKEVVSSDHHREHEQSSLNMLREGDRGRDHSLELDSETTSSNVNRHHYRRRGSRSSMHQNGRSGQTVVRRHGSTNGADHPRFRGSKLYSYSFRNLFWSAVACFLVGLLLRIYVIGPSFLKAVSSTSGSSASSATYYYYYHAPKQSAVSSSSSRTLLPTDGAGSRGNQHARAREDVMDNTVWPHGIREVFTVRRLLGWDFVLLAYPTQDEQR